MSRRISYERLGQIAAELTPRDREVVDLLSRHGLASGQQVRRAVWPEPGEAADRAARRAIDRLVRWRVLARLERRVGGLGRGSSSWTLALDTAGQRLLAGGTFPNARRPHLPRPAMWQHVLTGTEAHVRLLEQLRGSDTRLVTWDGEPASWRQYAGPYAEAVTLKPDAFVELAGPGYADLWFIEIDTGSQSTTVVRGKLTGYLRYAATGLEQRDRGVFPRVAFLTTTPERVDVLCDLVRARPETEWPLFAVGLVADAGRVLSGDWGSS